MTGIDEPTGVDTSRLTLIRCRVLYLEGGRPTSALMKMGSPSKASDTTGGIRVDNMWTAAAPLTTDVRLDVTTNGTLELRGGSLCNIDSVTWEPQLLLYPSCISRYT